jgi:LPXTG-motif cell wall-anchored protein
MDSRFFRTSATAPAFAYRPGAFRDLQAPGAASATTRSGEFAGMSSNTWLAIGAVGVVGVLLLAKKKRRR